MGFDDLYRLLPVYAVHFKFVFVPSQVIPTLDQKCRCGDHLGVVDVTEVVPVFEDMVMTIKVVAAKCVARHERLEHPVIAQGPGCLKGGKYDEQNPVIHQPSLKSLKRDQQDNRKQNQGEQEEGGPRERHQTETSAGYEPVERSIAGETAQEHKDAQRKEKRKYRFGLERQP